MKKEKQAKSELSALVLKGYELVFFRKFLGTELVVPELGKEKAEYIKTVLKPALESIDTQVNTLREASAKRKANGQFEVNEAGEIQYGTPEETAIIRDKFADIISADVILPITNQAQFLNVRDIFASLNQKLNEEDTEMYLQVLEKLNSVDIKSVNIK